MASTSDTCGSCSGAVGRMTRWVSREVVNKGLGMARAVITGKRTVEVCRLCRRLARSNART